MLQLIRIDARNRDVRTDPVHHQREQQTEKQRAAGDAPTGIESRGNRHVSRLPHRFEFVTLARCSWEPDSLALSF